MEFSPRAKALGVVLLLMATLALAWFKYYGFLNQGRSAPENAKLLNKFDEEGLPLFQLKSIDGRDLFLDAFKGKVVIINFWASWCDPCVAEFPSLAKLIENFKGEIVLIAISADYEEKDIHDFLKAFKYNTPYIHIAWDKDLTVANAYGTTRLPESYIVGRDGKLIRKVAGVDDWANADAFDYFNHLISEGGVKK